MNHWHLATLNSKGLEMAGINENTPDPPGGIIRRVLPLCI
jgi:predicted amidohydrolase YtcJ